MQIKRETKVVLTTTDNKEIKFGDVCVFTALKSGMIGQYNGITKRGSLCFNNIIDNSTFCVMPKSITEIYVVNENAVSGIKHFPMNPPV